MQIVECYAKNDINLIKEKIESKLNEGYKVVNITMAGIDSYYKYGVIVIYEKR